MTRGPIRCPPPPYPLMVGGCIRKEKQPEVSPHVRASRGVGGTKAGKVPPRSCTSRAISCTSRWMWWEQQHILTHTITDADTTTSTSTNMHTHTHTHTSPSPVQRSSLQARCAIPPQLPSASVTNRSGRGASYRHPISRQLVAHGLVCGRLLIRISVTELHGATLGEVLLTTPQSISTHMNTPDGQGQAIQNGPEIKRKNRTLVMYNPQENSPQPHNQQGGPSTANCPQPADCKPLQHHRLTINHHSPPSAAGRTSNTLGGSLSLVHQTTPAVRKASPADEG